MNAKVREAIRRGRTGGQAIVEYIIIIAIIAVAALTVLGIFSDRIRELIAGSASALGSNNAAAAYEQSSSQNTMQNMDKDGVPEF